MTLSSPLPAASLTTSPLPAAGLTTSPLPLNPNKKHLVHRNVDSTPQMHQSPDSWSLKLSTVRRSSATIINVVCIRQKQKKLPDD